MKLYLAPRELSWWTWLASAMLLFAGLAGHPEFFTAAILLSLGQCGIYWRKHRGPAAHPVQIRLAYAALLIICEPPERRWLYWLPAIGTTALVLFGYCLLGRVLSLMPWNYEGPITLPLLRRTFLSLPTTDGMSADSKSDQSLSNACVLEARVARSSLAPSAKAVHRPA